MLGVLRIAKWGEHRTEMLWLFRSADACSCHNTHLPEGQAFRLTSGKGRLNICQMQLQ